MRDKTWKDACHPHHQVRTTNCVHENCIKRSNNHVEDAWDFVTSVGTCIWWMMSSGHVLKPSQPTTSKKRPRANDPENESETPIKKRRKSRNRCQRRKIKKKSKRLEFCTSGMNETTKVKWFCESRKSGWKKVNCWVLMFKPKKSNETKKKSGCGKITKTWLRSVWSDLKKIYFQIYGKSNG